MRIMYRRKRSSASQWRKDIRCAGMCLILILLTWRIWWAPNNASKWQTAFNSTFKGLITDVKFIRVNFSLRSMPVSESCVKIFSIQITHVTETSGGSWLQGFSDSPHHNEYPTHWQDLHSKMFSTDFKPQNTIQQHRQHTDVNRFNMIQGPITACHFKRGNL
jgi:hypothetical protein